VKVRVPEIWVWSFLACIVIAAVCNPLRSGCDDECHMVRYIYFANTGQAFELQLTDCRCCGTAGPCLSTEPTGGTDCTASGDDQGARTTSASSVCTIIMIGGCGQAQTIGSIGDYTPYGKRQACTS
jgi:hypothetical protein